MSRGVAITNPRHALLALCLLRVGALQFGCVGTPSEAVSRWLPRGVKVTTACLCCCWAADIQMILVSSFVSLCSEKPVNKTSLTAGALNKAARQESSFHTG